VKNNLHLLAKQYNIDIAKASVIQAKILDLPVASGEINAINPQNKRVLDIGAKGQKAIAVQQLLYLGKKKQNEVEFAKSTIGIAELQFEQLLKNLRFELPQSFYSIYFNQLKITNINKQIASVDTLVKSYAVQAQRGNWPLRDVVRLQSLSFELKNDFMIAQKEINDEQESLKILTSSQENIIPVVEEQALNNYFTKNNLNIPFKCNLPSSCDFQVQGAINTALKENFGWNEGVNRLYTTLSQDLVYQNPEKLVPFVENHDTDRYFSLIGETLLFLYRIKNSEDEEE